MVIFQFGCACRKASILSRNPGYASKSLSVKGFLDCAKTLDVGSPKLSNKIAKSNPRMSHFLPIPFIFSKFNCCLDKLISSSFA